MRLDGFSTAPAGTRRTEAPDPAYQVTFGKPQSVAPQLAADTLLGQTVRVEQLSAPPGNLLAVALDQHQLDRARELYLEARDSGRDTGIASLSPVVYQSPFSPLHNPTFTRIPESPEDEVRMFDAKLRQLAEASTYERKLGEGVSVMVDAASGQYHAVRNSGEASATDYLRIEVDSMRFMNHDGRFDGLIEQYGRYI